MVDDKIYQEFLDFQDKYFDNYSLEERVHKMLDCLKAINWKKTGIFAAGVLFGTAGVKVLSSKDAKKVYTNCTAAVLRAKECVMNTVTTVQENAGDIYEEAKSINEERAAAAEAAAFADEAAEAEDGAAETEAAKEE